MKLKTSVAVVFFLPGRAKDLSAPLILNKFEVFNDANLLDDDYKLTLILLTWRIWWAPNNASKWQMGFNWAFRGLIEYDVEVTSS